MNDVTTPRSRPEVTGPLPIAPDCWLVGYRNPTAILQCNTYLRIAGSGQAKRNVCIDPGSQLDYSVIEANVSQLVGGVNDVDMITVNHQDPDVVGNVPAFCEANPRVNLMVTEDVWRLAQHLLVKPGSIQFANQSRSPSLKISGDVRWRAVATPFCHFRGAMAFYDPEIRTLFSGDLFGGINQLGRVHLFAEEHDWHGVAQFHQIYMPMREVLRYAVQQIRALDPPVEVIAPQHGHVIQGDRVPEFLDRMQELLVGHDLLAFELDERFQRKYEQVIQELVSWSADVLGEDEVGSRLGPDQGSDGLEQLLRLDGKDVKVRSEGYSALTKVFGRLCEGEPTEFANTVRGMVLSLCTAKQIPIPPIGVGVEGLAEGA